MAPLVASSSRSSRRIPWVSMIVICLFIAWCTLVRVVANSLLGNKNTPGRIVPVVQHFSNDIIDGRPSKSLAFEALDSMQPIISTDNGNTQPFPSGSMLPVNTNAELQAAESKLKPLKEYATSVTFAPKLDEGLYLMGCGVRKKSIINVYAVAMYTSAAVILNTSSVSLEKAAQSFDSSSPMTSFVLKMVYGVGAKKIASAIAESVRPRYEGSQLDITELESLVVSGVNNIGGKSVTGTVLRFDCSVNGVRVSVNEIVQGELRAPDLGGAFVRVYMDENTVSPSLVESCLRSWSDEEAQLLAASLLRISSEDENSLSERSRTTQEAVDKEKQELEASGIFTDENCPDISLANFPQPSNVQLAWSLCRKHTSERSIHPIAKNRARIAVGRRRDAIMDVLQSIQHSGSIQEMAFEQTAQKLRALASHHVI